MCPSILPQRMRAVIVAREFERMMIGTRGRERSSTLQEAGQDVTRTRGAVIFVGLAVRDTKAFAGLALQGKTTCRIVPVSLGGLSLLMEENTSRRLARRDHHRVKV